MPDRHPKMTVAFVQIVSRNARTLAVYAGADPALMTDRRRDALRHGDEDTPNYAARPRYWCAADAPVGDQADDFKLARVYRTSAVPEDARCETCGIHIRELQAVLGASPYPGEGSR